MISLDLPPPSQVLGLSHCRWRNQSLQRLNGWPKVTKLCWTWDSNPGSPAPHHPLTWHGLVCSPLNTLCISTPLSLHILWLHLRSLHPHFLYLDISSPSQAQILGPSSQKLSWTSPQGCVITASHANLPHNTSLATLSCLSPSPEYEPLEGGTTTFISTFPYS